MQERRKKVKNKKGKNSCFELFPFSELFLASTLQKKSGTCANPCREEEKGREHSVSPFLHSEKRKKKGGNKSFLNQAKAATGSEKQKHQNHQRLNSKICPWTNTQPAKLVGKLAEILNLNQVQLLIKEGLVSTPRLLEFLLFPAGRGQEGTGHKHCWEFLPLDQD